MGRTYYGTDRSGNRVEVYSDQDMTLGDANAYLGGDDCEIDFYASASDSPNREGGGSVGGGGGCLGILALGLPQLIHAVSSPEGQYILGEINKNWRA